MISENAVQDTSIQINCLQPTLSDIRSVILRSTQSLSPVLWASARRSLVIAFQTRLLSRGSSVLDSTGKKHKPCRRTTVFISSVEICLAFFFSSTDLYTSIMLTAELLPLLLFFPLALFSSQLPLPVPLLPQHISLRIKRQKTKFY